MLFFTNVIVLSFNNRNVEPYVCVLCVFFTQLESAVTTQTDLGCRSVDTSLLCTQSVMRYVQISSLKFQSCGCLTSAGPNKSHPAFPSESTMWIRCLLLYWQSSCCNKSDAISPDFLHMQVYGTIMSFVIRACS